MHRPGKPLVFFNVWDPVTARIVEQAGFPAIATSSAAIAWSEGYPDGQCISRGRMLERVRSIAQAVSVPVTADLESAYGETMEDAVITARGAIAAGVVGLNVEDALDGALLDLDKHCARIAAMKFAGAKLCVPLVINARTDVYWLGLGTDDEWRFAQTVFRANRFLEAGADCVFIPRVTQPRVIEKLVRAIHGPVNVLATGGLTTALLASLGVARISVGGAAMAHALRHFRTAAECVLTTGAFDFAADRIAHHEIDRLFGA